MITIFNRKELCVVFEMQKQTDMRKLLAENGIDYIIKTTNRMSASPVADSSRSRMGSCGQSMEEMYEYKFYVHKSDYDKARTLI
ncbi:MAG: hypothetical protein IJ335_09590 [Lachnospiraceae bacterium]|nr:hypothetical protein [Lachnospiraceae bacterium]